MVEDGKVRSTIQHVTTLSRQDDSNTSARLRRLMAQTFPDRQLTPEIWQRTVELDEERQRRMAARN